MTVRRMVALGSSFAAGPGIDPQEDRAAGRSARNWPHLVAERLGAHLIDATVSGATTATVLDAPQRAGRRRSAPQIESVGPDADLVVVTAGGNDLGYLGQVLGAALLQRLGRRRLTRPVARRLRARSPLAPVSAEAVAAATAGLVRIVEEVRRRAPAARVVLVDYLPIFTAGTGPGRTVPFSAAEVEHFRGVAAALSSAFREAAARTGADLVPASDLPQDHGVGAPVPWVFGLQPLRRLGSSFHPTADGMAGVAEAVVRRLRQERADRAAPGRAAGP